MEQMLEQRIRMRAYEIWHSQGCAEGNADEHWLAAEREVLSSAMSAQASTATARSETVSPRKARRGRAERRHSAANG